MNEPPDEEALRALLDALLGALLAFHRAGGGHGKVTPSNILLLADNRPLLLGPGAAGRAIASDPIDALMTSVEPCFAPIEQIIDADIPLASLGRPLCVGRRRALLDERGVARASLRRVYSRTAGNTRTNGATPALDVAAAALQRIPAGRARQRLVNLSR